MLLGYFVPKAANAATVQEWKIPSIFLPSEEQCPHFLELSPVVYTNGFDTLTKPVLAVIGCGDIGFVPLLVPLLKNLPAVIDGAAGGIGGGNME